MRIGEPSSRNEQRRQDVSVSLSSLSPESLALSLSLSICLSLSLFLIFSSPLCRPSVSSVFDDFLPDSFLTPDLFSLSLSLSLHLSLSLCDVRIVRALVGPRQDRYPPGAAQSAPSSLSPLSASAAAKRSLAQLSEADMYAGSLSFSLSLSLSLTHARAHSLTTHSVSLCWELSLGSLSHFSIVFFLCRFLLCPPSLPHSLSPSPALSLSLRIDYVRSSDPLIVPAASLLALSQQLPATGSLSSPPSLILHLCSFSLGLIPWQPTPLLERG